MKKKTRRAYCGRIQNLLTDTYFQVFTYTRGEGNELVKVVIHLSYIGVIGATAESICCTRDLVQQQKALGLPHIPYLGVTKRAGL